MASTNDGRAIPAVMAWRVCAGAAAIALSIGIVVQAGQQSPQSMIGREVAIERHLEDDEEFRTPLLELLEQGRRLFAANWTDQEGGGRPLTKGTGKQLTDPASRWSACRGFNRISAPDANSCAGCHNLPYGIAGGGGDFVTNVFVLAQRFDFVTFDPQRHAADPRGGRRSAASRSTPTASATPRLDAGHVRRRLSRDAGARDDQGPARASATPSGSARAASWWRRAFRSAR